MAFLDESGFLLIPTVRRTWAPKGQTPVLRHSYRRDRISTLSAITVSPRRYHLGLCVQFHRRNITGVEVVGFLRQLLRLLAGKVVLVWDNGPIHRRLLVREFLRRHHHRLHVYPFPAYAPELNPDEQVWTQAKAELANSTPHNIDQLDQQLRCSLHRIGASQALLWSCIMGSDLP
jgi:transposase